MLLLCFYSVGNFLFQMRDNLKVFKVHLASLDWILYSFQANFPYFTCKPCWPAAVTTKCFFAAYFNMRISKCLQTNTSQHTSKIIHYYARKIKIYFCTQQYFSLLYLQTKKASQEFEENWVISLQVIQIYSLYLHITSTLW